MPIKLISVHKYIVSYYKKNTRKYDLFHMLFGYKHNWFVFNNEDNNKIDIRENMFYHQY